MPPSSGAGRLVLVVLALGGWSCGLALPAQDDASLAWDGAAGDAVHGADGPSAGADAGPPGECAMYGEAISVGTVEEPDLTELSGLAASRRNPGVFYAHNDSGDAARFFAVGSSGASLGELTLAGAEAVDWEDMAVGPCPEGWCVFLGDVGDNPESRTSYDIYRVPEPEVNGSVGLVDVTWQRFSFVYPDGSHNCEALLVHPQTGDLYMVVKVMSSSADVYRLAQPLDATGTVTLEKVGAVTIPFGFPSVTGGDIHPSGSRLLLRTYTNLFELAVTTPASFVDVLAATPTSVPVAIETQGEAVAYTEDGRGYVTASEGVSPTLFLAGCRD